MNNRFDRVCGFAETVVLQQDMAEDVDIYGILNTAQRETGEELEDPDFDAAVQWLDYFCADQGYTTKSMSQILSQPSGSLYGLWKSTGVYIEGFALSA